MEDGSGGRAALPEGILVRTVVLTDLVGSTDLVERLGDHRGAALFARVDAATRDALHRHGGVEIDKSDGFLILFERPGAAVSFAADLHAALTELSARQGEPVATRVGVHLGEVLVRGNAPELVARGAKPIEVEGRSKPVAARVMSLCPGGRTLLTRAAFDVARRSLGDAFVWVSHGRYTLQGLPEPVEICEVAPAGAEPGPPPASAKARPAAEARTNLRPPVDRFFGRTSDVERIRALVADGRRLVTVLGPGGAGKTRLSVEAGLSLAHGRRGGAWFCDLAAARQANDVTRALAVALAVPLTDGGRLADDVERLGRALDGRGDPLVVLDNFEQVTAHAAETVGRWLEAAPAATFLVTSRERLRLAEEHLVELEPLGLDDAVGLFEDRARRVRPGYTVSDADRSTVRTLAARLDGMPLALELAAARMRVHTPRTLLERLEQRFDLLRSGGTGRQATMRAAIDWSWALLTPAEQAALAQCSVFRGGFSLADAEVVLSPGPGAPLVDELVEALRDRSLVRSWEPDRLPGELRFGLYDTIRAYAEERLAERDDRTETEVRHAQRFADLAGEGARSDMRRLALDLDNLLAAVDRTLATRPALAYAAGMMADKVLFEVGPRQRAADLLERLAGAADALTPVQQVWVFVRVARHRAMAGDGPAAVRALARAADVAGRTRDPALARTILVERADMSLGVDAAGAETALRRALDEAHAAGSQAEVGSIQASLSQVLRARGRLEEALELLRASLDSTRRQGAWWRLAGMLQGVAILEIDLGQGGEARAHLDEVLELLRERGGGVGEALALAARALLDLDEERFVESEQGYRESVSRLAGCGLVPEMAVETGNLGILCHLRGRLSEARDAYLVAEKHLAGEMRRWPRGYFRAHRAALEADAGRVTDAEVTLAGARQDGGDVGDPALLALCDVCGAHLALARGARADAEQVLARHEAAGRRSVDLRLALRRLRAAIPSPA